MGEVPTRFGVIKLHAWPPVNSHEPRFKSTKKRRIRKVCGLVVAKTLAASFPLKSPSAKPIMLLTPYLPAIFKFQREYWPVARYSVRCPAAVLLKGIAPKFVLTTLPVFTVRKMFWKSTKPPGVKSVPPMRIESGDSLGFSVSCTTEVVLVVVRAALVRRGVESTCFLAASSCRNCSICCCWLAIASCKVLIWFEMRLSSVLVLLGALWPKTKHDARSKKQICRNNFIQSPPPIWIT